jgi:hypothetical protein
MTSRNVETLFHFIPTFRTTVPRVDNTFIYIFICSPFNDGLSNSDNILFNGCIVIMNFKDVKRRGRGLV